MQKIYNGNRIEFFVLLGSNVTLSDCIYYKDRYDTDIHVRLYITKTENNVYPS